MSRRLKTQAVAGNPTNVTMRGRMMSQIAVRIIGITPIIQNNFSQKSMEEMLSKHMGNAVERAKKVPRQLIEDAKILNMRGEVCTPPTGIKKAMLTASALLKLPKATKKGQLRQSIFIDAQSIPLQFGSMLPRLDMVRTSGMTRAPDVRFRPQFDDWSATFPISYAEDIISLDLLLNLLARAGDGVGIGEWRPEKDGTFGRFRIEPNIITEPKKIGAIRDLCSSPLKPLTIPEWALDHAFEGTSETAKMIKKVYERDLSDDEDDVAETGE